MQIKRILFFLVLTFALTWGFELLISRTITEATYMQTKLNPLGMFFPAFSALVLQIFVFKDSPIYFRTYREKPRWIFFTFLIVTVLYSFLTLLVLITQNYIIVWQGVGGIFIMLWTLFIFFFYPRCSAESLQRVGLYIGDKDLGVRFIVGVILFLLSQALLNWLFGLGVFSGIQDNLGGVPFPRSLYSVGLIIFFLINAIGTPLSGLATTFGEEYGWRGFLHHELIKLGPRLGVLLVGLIWGIWHFPIILSGIHTYPPTASGLLLGVIFFILAGYVFGYAVMKTRSIWVVTFMHGVLNSIYPFILNYLVRPEDKVFSFGLGIYGLCCLSIVVLLLFRDPIWQSQSNELSRLTISK